MKIIRDKYFFDEMLKKSQDSALNMLKDSHGHYFEEVQIGMKQYKIFTSIPNSLFIEGHSDLLPKDYVAFIIGDIDYEKKEIARSDFRNWYFIGDANFKRAKFSGIADFGGAFIAGVLDFRGAKIAKYADFEGAVFTKYADYIGCG